MTTVMPRFLSFSGRRVRYETERSFDEVLATLRTTIGDATRGELGAAVRDCGTQESFARRMQEVAGDSGFMLFFEMDHGVWLKTFGVRRKIVRRVFGNPIIAYTMLRHDVAAGLFAPIEFVLIENESGHGSTLTYDLPSSLMVIDDNPPLLEAAKALDRKLVELVERVMSAITRELPVCRRPNMRDPWKTPSKLHFAR
jgi:uncharacterized protein (DUF302 family)